MSGLIDTNILLYAANEDAEEHRAAVTFLRAAADSGSRWFLAEGIVYEFLRVATHSRVFPRPLSWLEALEFLHPFFAHPDITILSAAENHWRLLSDLSTLVRPAGNLFFDVRTVVLMREHGIRRIFTADTDFLQFPDIEVINPLRPS
jgi:uncharacterized protein